MSAEAQRRVVITGLGVIAPNGSDIATFWASILAGQSAAGPLTRFPAAGAPVSIACEVRDFAPEKYMEPKIVRRLDRSLQFGIAAAHLATRDSGLNITSIEPDRIGIVEGTTVSNNETAARASEAWNTRGYKGVSLFSMINGYSGGGSGEIAIELGIKGHAITLSSGSASGNDVMGYALDDPHRRGGRDGGWRCRGTDHPADMGHVLPGQGDVQPPRRSVRGDEVVRCGAQRLRAWGRRGIRRHGGAIT